MRDDVEALCFVAGHMAREAYVTDRQVCAAGILSALAPGSSSVGLEIGSGEGLVAEHIAARCGHLICADISASLLVRARQRCANRTNVAFHLIRNDYLDGISADSVDFAYALNVFIHLNHYELYHYLVGLRRVLRPRGRAWFNIASLTQATMPYFLEFAEAYRAHPPDRPSGDMVFHSAEEIRQLAMLAGFSSWSAVEEDGMVNCVIGVGVA